MTDTITLPLAADVDVSDMPFMPLKDQRLTKSRAWVKAKHWRGGGPGLAFCLMNLWISAFRSVPAGSLDGDDEMLAEAADVDIEFWHLVKESALLGWERHGGRLWHPVVAELALELWTTRLKSRYTNAQDRWRLASKRATDKGEPPPDPPGAMADWLAREYPDSAAYAAAKVPQGSDGATAQAGSRSDNPICRPDNVESLTDIRLKRSEAKGITPLYPPGARGEAQGAWNGPPPRTQAERHEWFETEFGRLRAELGSYLQPIMSCLNRPGTSSRFVLVEVFRGTWVVDDPGGPAILFPTKQRADAVLATHGEWLRTIWPGVTVRQATTAEKRVQSGRLTA